MTTIRPRRSTDTAEQGGLDRVDVLEQRLTATAAALGVDTTCELDGRGDTAQVLLDRIVGHVAVDVTDDKVWLLLVALSGVFPLPEDVVSLRRALRTRGRDDLMVDVLRRARQMRGAGSSSPMTVVSDRAVVDVDFSARHDLHTGIQRVVRETLPRWAAAHDLVLTAWNDDDTAMRALLPHETDRVLRFRHGTPPARPHRVRPEARPIVVPWQTTLVLPEVPRGVLADRVRSLTVACTVAAIGYDCIPVVSADTLPAAEPVKFVRYLSMLKHVDRVVAISAAAAEEFAGFTDMLPTQGLAGPAVAVCGLPVEVAAPPAAGGTGLTPGRPQVLAVGSHDPRKNHLAVLHAAERLWLEGVDFSLVFVGGKGWRAETFDDEVRRLQRAGHPIRTARGVGDEELWSLYDSARFSVFASLHEGYGLPVAESLARGVPVLTSSRGSTAEIARGGGALAVDPTDDEAVLDGMRRLLVDDALVTRLREEARTRPTRTWADYARELWDLAVVGTPA